MGKVTVVGGKVGVEAPATGILARDIAVGSTVYLNENGSPVEYLVVNQGIPSGSSLYDSSCDGTWLLRKDIHSTTQWSGVQESEYGTSDVHTYLNNGFLASFDNILQNSVKTVNIPWYTNITHEVKNLSARIFLLGCCEVGLNYENDSAIPTDGAKLNYFEKGSSAGSTAILKRVAYLNGIANMWWLRSPRKNYPDYVYTIYSSGSCNSNLAGYTYGVRPALILPFNALFNEDTLVLKGVK